MMKIFKIFILASLFAFLPLMANAEGFIPESSIVANMDFDSVYGEPTVITATTAGNPATLQVPANAPSGFKYYKDNKYWSGDTTSPVEIVADADSNLSLKNGWGDTVAFAGFTSNYSATKPVNDTYISFRYKTTQENPNELFGKLVFSDNKEVFFDMEYSSANGMLFNIISVFPHYTEGLTRSEATIISSEDKSMLKQWHEYGIRITAENGYYVFTGYLDGEKQNTYKSDIAVTTSSLLEYYVGCYEVKNNDGYGYIDDVIIANGGFLSTSVPDDGEEEEENEFLPEASIRAMMDFDSVYGEETILTATTAGNPATITIPSNAPSGFKYHKDNKFWGGDTQRTVEIVEDIDLNLSLQNGWGDTVVFAGFDSNYSSNKPTNNTYISFRFKTTQTDPNEVFGKLVFSDGTEIFLNLRYSSTGNVNGLSIAPAINSPATDSQMTIIPINDKAMLSMWHEYGVHITNEDGCYTFTGYLDRVKQNTYKSDKILSSSVLNEYYVGNYEVWQRDGYGYIDDIIIADGGFLSVSAPDDDEEKPEIAPPELPTLSDSLPLSAKESYLLYESFNLLESGTYTGQNMSYWPKGFYISTGGNPQIVADPTDSTNQVLYMSVAGLNSPTVRGPQFNTATTANIEDSDIYMSFRMYAGKNALMKIKTYVSGDAEGSDFMQYIFQNKYIYPHAPESSIGQGIFTGVESAQWHEYGLHIYRLKDTKLDFLSAKSANVDVYIDNVKKTSYTMYLTSFVDELSFLNFAGFELIPYADGTACEIYLDDFQVRYVTTDSSIIPPPPATEDEENTVNPEKETVLAEVPKEVDTLSPFKIKVTSSKPTTITCKIYSKTNENDVVCILQQETEDNGKAEIAVPAIAKEGEYIVVVGGGYETVSYTVSVKNISELSATGSGVVSDSVATITLNVNNVDAKEDKPYSAIVVCCDEKGAIVKVLTESFTTTAEKNIVNNFTKQVPATVKSVKVYVWKNLSTLKPY